jgi:hypothetical protein
MPRLEIENTPSMVFVFTLPRAYSFAPWVDFTLPSRSTTNVGFISLDNAATSAEEADLAIHGQSDAMGHEPCSLVGDTQGAVNLMGADSLFGGTQQVNRQQPLGQANFAALKNSAYGHGELFTASHALHKAWTMGFALKRIRASYGAAMRAYRAIRPAQLLQVFASFAVAGEVRDVEHVHD